MLKIEQSKKLGRLLRQDSWPDLGIPTQVKLIQAIEAGNLEEAKILADYMVSEGKSLHDMSFDWIWDIYTRLAEQQGEEAVYRMSRATQETWMLKRTWKVFLSMSVEERVYISAEIMRSHRCGPQQDGTIELIEDNKRISIKMDPCGSGGRMRRGDPVDGTPSRLGPPYNFGVTQEPHWWCWQRQGVPYYCIHCVINEILPIEWGGYPLWVTGYSDDADEPCYWHFYKSPELIPDEYFTRLGFKKPDLNSIESQTNRDKGA
ncbi:MAG: hypothetical protein HOK67_20050 [Deltaproteobacteria bacterium]|jgi:hypothetical protein|nr:hypothetical protein [Deltaproteobacteria bacterium]MBT4641329.1 hypothetical protein [Deltaproteobacteria bacterium]MBT6502183.1 hypothetical protein [Deltaproteobacteria bacterium]MBT7155586.1 hypothetical protein [Deltaproteobacteria bacterium]MBT7712057.1 hypothetical protein [Deltaproteobacteria bacterium]